jgi:hypothetical protein
VQAPTGLCGGSVPPAVEANLAVTKVPVASVPLRGKKIPGRCDCYAPLQSLAHEPGAAVPSGSPWLRVACGCAEWIAVAPRGMRLCWLGGGEGGDLNREARCKKI